MDGGDNNPSKINNLHLIAYVTFITCDAVNVNIVNSVDLNVYLWLVGHKSHVTSGEG